MGADGIIRRTLRNVQLRGVYATADLDAAFLRNCLRNATAYRRSAGYFRSSLFRHVGPDFIKFAMDGGRMRLVCSPDLRDDDWRAINEGYATRRDVLRRATIRSSHELLSTGDRPERLDVLAWLIATGALDIKVALRSSGNGIFHDKVGIFTDTIGDRVVFNGSGNETYEGWFDHDGNHETVSVFRSWIPGHDDFVAGFEEYFETIWADHSPELIVESIPQEATDLFRARDTAKQRGAPEARDHTLAGRTPLCYQERSLENWRLNHGRGIFQYATGAGKTIAAMLVVREHLRAGNTALIVVPGKELLSQWELELGTTFPDVQLLVASSQRSRWRERGVLEAFTLPDHRAKIVLTTLQTAKTDAFLSRVSGGPHLLLVADEVHETGAVQAQSLFRLNAERRLGISATPQRYRDPAGTSAILTYFGDILQPIITLADAIAYDRLVPYEYHPHRAPLNEEESQMWLDQTRRIRRIVAREKKGADAGDYSSFLQQLFIKRARILKTASAKLSIVSKIFERPPASDERWLIYCDDQNQVRDVVRLLRDRHILCFEYHTAMSGDPEATLRYIADQGGIVVSIRCLDQGIDLPALNRALILASSRNPRQYIQRRGRVLRKAPDKYLAIIHDAVVLPPIYFEGSDQTSLLGTELRRSLEFSRTAVNATAELSLRQIMIDFDIDPETLPDLALEA